MPKLISETGELKETARSLRRSVVSMLFKAGSGHPGGSLSAVDILTALYFNLMRVDAAAPDDPRRDRLVLCKGHAAPALYAALALKGCFPDAELDRLRTLGSFLQGHPDMRKTPGVDMSTGSLGQGLSAACGMALGARLNDGHKCDPAYRVYAILGDGETEEGQVWEAAMFAAHYKLDNLIAFIDHNRLQIDGRIREVMSPEPLADKWRAFGWQVFCVDGHDIAAIIDTVHEAWEAKDRPSMILAETVKGKGVSFMENDAAWHGAAPNAEQTAAALAELEAAFNVER